MRGEDLSAHVVQRKASRRTKSSAQHTPGPWQAGEPVTSDGHTVYVRISCGDQDISTTSVYGHRPDGVVAGRAYVDRFGTERHPPHVSEQECHANARLIAAAPELLDALRMAQGEMVTLVARLTPEYAKGVRAVLDAAKEVMAKVEGK